MDDYLRDVPVPFHPLFKAVVSLTDRFCDLYLNDEYRDMCREMAAALCVDGTPMTKGRPLSWAAGIANAVGWVNFLQDPSFEPHMTTKQMAKRLAVSQGTMLAKSKIIREGLELMPFDPDWCLPSLMEENPLAWMVEVDGLIVDARHMSPEFQQKAYEAGLIPGIPKEPGSEEGGDDDPGHIIAKVSPASGQ
jgi:hypothetical protein